SPSEQESADGTHGPGAGPDHKECAFPCRAIDLRSSIETSEAHLRVLRVDLCLPGLHVFVPILRKRNTRFCRSSGTTKELLVNRIEPSNIFDSRKLPAYFIIDRWKRINRLRIVCRAFAIRRKDREERCKRFPTCHVLR